MTARYDSDRHHRRSIRLKGYDYTLNGAYFVTIVVQNRLCVFGDVDDDDMRLNEAGNMVAGVWDSLTTRFPHIDLDAFVVMPNHIHGIIVVTNGDMSRVAPLGAVVGAYKSLATVEYVRGVKTSGWPPFAGKLWQRNYYEHIIRNETALNRIRRYIMENPARWAEDPENPVGAPLVGAHVGFADAHDKSPVGAPLVGAHVGITHGMDARSVGAHVGTRKNLDSQSPAGDATGPGRLGGVEKRATTRVAPTRHGDDEADA